MADEQVHTVQLTTQQLIELRDFAAYAVREKYGAAAARRRVITVCEHVLLRAMLKPPEVP